MKDELNLIELAQKYSDEDIAVSVSRKSGLTPLIMFPMIQIYAGP